MTRLNRALQEQIVAAIRAGAFPHVAAGAFGVSRRTYERWRKRGRSARSCEPYRSFSRAVDEAIAQARLRAEMSVFTDQPRIWLQHGPGRESSGNRGWTVAVKPSAASKVEANPFLMPEMIALAREIQAALEPFPEARDKVDQLFERRATSDT